MQSHLYDFKPADVFRVIAWPLVPLAVFTAAMHAGARTGLLPAPRPTLDVDRTVLVHQAEASRAPNDAQVLLLGDSSCLMDVSARQLAEQIGRPVLNLGTLSYLNLGANALLLRHYENANPGRLRAAVILMHPEALRLGPSDAWQTRAMESFLNGTDHFQAGRPSERAAHALGLDIFRGRVLARALPAPLPGSFGRRYGFTVNLERFLTENRGSAIDPESKPPSGSAEYRLAPAFKLPSAAFRQSLPPGARLFVGITPVPAGFAGPGYAALQRRMLQEWGAWLKADAVLTNLPATLPPELFAQKTHLNEAGQRAYTERLAEVLRGLLP
jgi:hypothetical protein